MAGPAHNDDLNRMEGEMGLDTGDAQWPFVGPTPMTVDWPIQYSGPQVHQRDPAAQFDEWMAQMMQAASQFPDQPVIDGMFPGPGMVPNFGFPQEPLDHAMHHGNAFPSVQSPMPSQAPMPLQMPLPLQAPMPLQMPMPLQTPMIFPMPMPSQTPMTFLAPLGPPLISGGPPNGAWAPQMLDNGYTAAQTMQSVFSNEHSISHSSSIVQDLRRARATLPSSEVPRSARPAAKRSRKSQEHNREEASPGRMYSHYPEENTPTGYRRQPTVNGDPAPQPSFGSPVLLQGAPQGTPTVWPPPHAEMASVPMSRQGLGASLPLSHHRSPSHPRGHPHRSSWPGASRRNPYPNAITFDIPTTPQNFRDVTRRQKSGRGRGRSK